MSRGKRSGTWQQNIEPSRIAEFPIRKSYQLSASTTGLYLRLPVAAAIGIDFFGGHRDLSSSSLVASRPGRFGAKHIATAGALVAIGITMGILGDLQSEKAGDHCKDIGDFFLLGKGKASQYDSS